MANGSIITRRQFLAFALQFMAVACLPGCRKKTPVQGDGALSDLFVAEDHSQLLAKWSAAGIRDAVLVNLDTHDDFHHIPDDSMRSLKDIYQKKDWRRFADADSRVVNSSGLYGIGNWIYAGARLGMFKEVYWVIPNRYGTGDDAIRFLPAFLESIEFSPEDIKTFTFRDNLFRGTIFGIPVTICGIEALPLIHSPILLSVDVDFFPTYVSEYKVPYLTALNSVFTALFAKKYQIQAAGASYSVNGEFLLPHHRWVGDAVKTILADPGMIVRPVPELLTLQQLVDNEYRSRDAAKMLALIKGAPAGSATEPSLLIYEALAHMLQGDADAAYAAAMAGCRADRLYATALPFMGELYFSKGQYATSEKFFRGGYAVDSQISNGLFHFGNCLVKNGKLREAIGVYELDVKRNGSFPTHFLMAQTYLVLGERQAALATLKLALNGLIPNANTRVVSRLVADAIYAGLEFCDQENYQELGAALRRTRTVTDMYKTFPRK